MRWVCPLAAALALAACSKGATTEKPSYFPPVTDAGPFDAGPTDAGPVGTPDAGPADAGPPPSPAHTIGGLGPGPFPAGPLTIYGSAQGLLEPPLSASIDEGENLWVVTEKALYLLEPGARVLRRYTARDGLHVGPGYTEPPDFTMVEGGARGECFVGYYARDTNDSMFKGAHMDTDPWAHMGKMDQVLLRTDRTLEVHRYDLRNSNDGHYYETRTVNSMFYDHFHHPGNLYVGSNHGVTRIVPAKYFPPRHLKDDPFNTADEREWYADHVHPWVCQGGPCDPTRPVAFGDYYGLTMAPDGRLWMGGLTTGGAIRYKEELSEWWLSWEGHNPFWPAFEYPPIFQPPRQGDSVNVRGVAVTPDGVVWFASGAAEGWRGATYGLAAWSEFPNQPATRQPNGRFTYFDPLALGALEYNILEIQAWTDGRLVLGFPSTGLLVWKPGDRTGHRITQGEGLPGENIGRMSLDRMHDPPLLLVPTNGGLAVFRQIP